MLNKRRHVSRHAVQLDGENLPRKVAVSGKFVTVQLDLIAMLVNMYTLFTAR